MAYEVWILNGRWHQKLCETKEEALRYVAENMDAAEKIEVISEHETV